jgi:hypothetical protein
MLENIVLGGGFAFAAAVLIAGLAVFIVAAGSARFLGPAGQRLLLILSAAALAALGVYQLIVSVWLASGE